MFYAVAFRGHSGFALGKKPQVGFFCEAFVQLFVYLCHFICSASHSISSSVCLFSPLIIN